MDDDIIRLRVLDDPPVNLRVSNGTLGSYPPLTHKPMINGVTLVGNKTSHDIRVQDEMDALSVSDIEKILYLG